MMMGEGACVPPWSQHARVSGVDVGGGDEVAAAAAAVAAGGVGYDCGCDEFRMYEFKVRKCTRASSHDWSHPGEKARRRDPRRHSYSCVPCPEFRKDGGCRKGDNCEYAHGVFECWLHPAQYRTRLCKDGVGCARRICFFAHTPDQLRLPVLPTTQQQQQQQQQQSSPRGAACSPLAESYDGSPLRSQAFESDLTKSVPLARQRHTPHPQVPNGIEAEEEERTHGARRYVTDALRPYSSIGEIKEAFRFFDTCEYNTENIKFSVFFSQEGGTDIKDGSKMILVPKHCSVHHPVVQMVLFPELTSDSFYCLCPMVPRGITDLIEKSSSDKCIDAVQTVYKAVWVDARGHSTKSHNGDAVAPVTYAVAPVTQAQTAGDDNRRLALWLDSGAGHHCAYDASVLCNLRDPPAGTAVRMADGFRLPVTKIGDIRTENFQIPDVYLVPGLQMNVISVRQLAKCKIFPTFYENHAVLCRDGREVGGAIVDDDASIYRLYYLAAVGNAAASTS